MRPARVSSSVVCKNIRETDRESIKGEVRARLAGFQGVPVVDRKPYNRLAPVTFPHPLGPLQQIDSDSQVSYLEFYFTNVIHDSFKATRSLFASRADSHNCEHMAGLKIARYSLQDLLLG